MDTARVRRIAREAGGAKDAGGERRERGSGREVRRGGRGGEGEPARRRRPSTCSAMPLRACARVQTISERSEGARGERESETHQSSPSSKPSPLIAQLLKMLHCRFLSVSSPRPSLTSAADMASGWSCGREQEKGEGQCQLADLCTGPTRPSERADETHLLVGKDEELCVVELLLVEHGEELGLVDGEAVAVGRVDDVNDGLGVGVIAPPVGPDRGLAAEVPHLELDVLVLHGFDVEPDGRDGRHDLADLQPVQDRRLAAVAEQVVSLKELGVLGRERERGRTPSRARA